MGGIALGGGFNLATFCDLIIASESAIFGHPELMFGLNPLFNPLRQIVGMAKAKEITMLGQPIGAKEALADRSGEQGGVTGKIDGGG